MTIVCSATGCSSRAGVLDKNNEKISFHRFPKNPEINKKWVQNMRRVDWTPSKFARLCSLHFEPACYQDGYSRRILQSYAVPTIFPNQLSALKKCPKKRMLIMKSSNETSTSSSQECQTENIKCPKKRRQVLNTSNEASTSSVNQGYQDENGPMTKGLKSKLEHYKMLAEKRGRKLKNLQRKFSRVVEKKDSLEVILNILN